MAEPRPTILVIDDEPLIRGVMGKVLAAEGYDVMEAYCGAEAFRCPGPIHLLVCDVRLAGEFGPDLARAPAAGHTGLRVLYVSGATELHRPLPSGCTFLAKPFEPDVLVKLVRELLGQAEGGAAGD